jgi:hypothetical protein
VTVGRIDRDPVEDALVDVQVVLGVRRGREAPLLRPLGCHFCPCKSTALSHNANANANAEEEDEAPLRRQRARHISSERASLTSERGASNLRFVAASARVRSGGHAGELPGRVGRARPYAGRLGVGGMAAVSAVVASCAAKASRSRGRARR